MAENDELPKVLAHTHKKFKTPHIAMILTAIVILIFTIQTSFIEALTISTITRLFVYATTCAALPVFRWRKDAPEAKFKIPYGIVAAVLSFGLIVWLLSRVKLPELKTILVVAAIGLILYFIQRVFNKRDVKSETNS